MSAAPSQSTAAVLGFSEEMPAGSVEVKGFDFSGQYKKGESPDLHALLSSFITTGFQASNFGLAVKEINRMRNWRLSDIPVTDDEDEDFVDPEVRKTVKCKIFLGYTSNLISAGTRESIRFLAENRMVDVIVSSAGGIEEDLIKCLAPTYMGDFHSQNGQTLRKKGLNRIANMLVPNKNYVLFEEWCKPILDAMLDEQKSHGIVWSPSKMIHRFGKEIDHPDSVYYWCYKNNIPVFSPSLTDGSIGDMIYFHSFNNPGLIVDIASDIRAMNDQAISAKQTGQIILGGGMVKHHINNANLMRNGANFSVNVNTAQEFDGSDAGAGPDEAVSWGKIRMDATPVKVCADASIIFPLLVAQTFAMPEQRVEVAAEIRGGAK